MGGPGTIRAALGVVILFGGLIALLYVAAGAGL
jgi:hypothetical protein